LVRDCVFRENDNGLTGGTQDSEITVEFSEFDANGNPAAPSSAPTHNIYVYGGTFTLRHSYVHDPVQGQNFHVRSRAGTIEYSWIARARSYEGDLMTDDDLDGSAPARQSLLLRGNVIVQSGAPLNGSQVVAVYNDARIPGLTLDVRLVNNTFVGNGGRAALVHLSNADGTAMSAELSNNLIAGTTVPILVETASSATVAGRNNWLATGVDPGPLAGTVHSASPGFANPGAKDFTLAAGSAAIGAAGPSASGLPDREYYRDETERAMYRSRASALDIGAFEHTTSGPGIGAYGAPLPGPAPTSPTPSGGCGNPADDGAALAGVLWVALRWLRQHARSIRAAGGGPRGAPAPLGGG
jgi:hypothetical protein